MLLQPRETVPLCAEQLKAIRVFTPELLGMLDSTGVFTQCIRRVLALTRDVSSQRSGYISFKRAARKGSESPLTDNITHCYHATEVSPACHCSDGRVRPTFLFSTKCCKTHELG